MTSDISYSERARLLEIREINRLKRKYPKKSINELYRILYGR